MFVKMLTLYYLMKKSQKDNNLDVCTYYKDLQKNGHFQSKPFNTRCRICLQKGSVSLLDNANNKLLEALENVAGIRISAHDHFPKHLCSTCHKFIQGALMFRKIAKETEEFLNRPVIDGSLHDHNYSQHHLSNDTDLNESNFPNNYTEDCTVKKEKKPRLKLSRNVSCKVCNKVVTRSYYKHHKTMHDADHKKYVCDVCGKSFRLKSAYYTHSWNHSNDFPYKCKLCPYKGKSSVLLKMHMRSHSEEYRYMCSECPKQFHYKSNLNKHMLKHEEPQFKCDSCTKAFYTKNSMQKHFESKHLGIRKHICSFCGIAFGNRKSLTCHHQHEHKIKKRIAVGRLPAYLEAERSLNQDKE